MAYDPNCAETKAALKAAVAAALAEQAEEHDADVEGLKKKNRELLADLKMARKGGGGEDQSAEVSRLEDELATNRKELKAAQKAAETAATERDEAVAAAKKESDASRALLVDQGLTAELVAANVKTELLPAVTALLKGKVEIKEVGGERKAFAGGKPLGEFVKDWSQGDEGKHYVSAAVNGGGGVKPNPKNPQGGEKKISEMSYEERKTLQSEDPNKFNERVLAERDEQRKADRKPVRRSGF